MSKRIKLNPLKNKRGFTIIEMVISIAIVSYATTLAFSMISKINESKTEINDAAMFATINASYIDEIQVLIDEGELLFSTNDPFNNGGTSVLILGSKKINSEVSVTSVESSVGRTLYLVRIKSRVGSSLTRTATTTVVLSSSSGGGYSA